MTDDLATWLTQILDEDEERVRAAIADDGGQDGGFEDSFDQLTGGEERGGPLAFVPRFGEAAAAMIVWQTPRRALARIEADRQMLALHEARITKLSLPPFDSYTGEPRPAEFEVNCSVCGWASDDPTSACQTVRLLAVWHADRPGYREDWRP